MKCLLLSLAVGIAAETVAQKLPAGVPAPLQQAAFFEALEPVAMTLTTDLKMLRRKKQKQFFIPATVTLTLPNGDTASGTVQVSARGEFRRQQCQMPSLMVNFRTATAGKLAGLRKLKMVVGCRSGDYHEEFVLKEFLAYRLYNHFTDMSFRVRLVKTTFVDAGNNEKAYQQHAFFIEDVDAMARRNGCREFNGKLAHSLRSDHAQLVLVNIFQYMIGNLDWSIPNFHNIKLIQPRTDSTARPFVVPYDFDFCGLVNAPYAFPQEEFQAFEIARVTDRFYRGFPTTPDMVDAAVQRIQAQRPAITALLNEFALLPLPCRKEMIGFLDGFFKLLENQRDVKAIFIEASRRN